MAVQPFSIAKRVLFGRRPEQGAPGRALPEAHPDNGATDHAPPRRPLRVLAIDGGGIRGILPAMVLSDLERRTNRPIIDLFDLIGNIHFRGKAHQGFTPFQINNWILLISRFAKE